VADLRTKGADPILVDGGDALFRNLVVNPMQTQRAREMAAAELILECYDRMGTTLFVPGVRDFAAGLDFLKGKRVENKNLVFLAANLVDDQDALLFEKSQIEERNGVKVGFFAVVTTKFGAGAAKAQGSGFKVLDPAAVAKETVAELRPRVDVLIMIAHVDEKELKTLLPQCPGVDLVLHAHNLRRAARGSSEVAGVPVIQGYNRGRKVADATLFFRKKGEKFTDSGRRVNLESRLERVERNIESRKERSKQSPERHSKMLERLAQQKADIEQQLKELKATANTFTLEMVSLDRSIQEDPEIVEMIKAYKAEHPRSRGKVGAGTPRVRMPDIKRPLKVEGGEKPKADGEEAPVTPMDRAKALEEASH